MTVDRTFNSDPSLVEISSMGDLARYFGASDSTLGALNRRLYKDTACGAHLSVQEPGGAWHHNGEDAWSGAIGAIQVGSIVEGSDAEVDGDTLAVPVAVADLDQQIFSVEDEADGLWHEANDAGRYQCSLCAEIVCDHEQEQHATFHSPEQGAWDVIWERGADE